MTQHAARSHMPCPGRIWDLELLSGRSLGTKEQRELIVHVRTCATCYDQARWIHWSNDLIRAAFECRPGPGLQRRLTASTIESLGHDLATQLDRTGTRLLIASEAKQNRVVRVKLPPLASLLQRARQTVARLLILDSSNEPNKIAGMLRRILESPPSKEALKQYAHQLFSAAHQLDQDLAKPLLHRIQASSRRTSIASVEADAEKVLCLSSDDGDRATALIELASARLSKERDLSGAVEAVDMALHYDSTRPDVIAAAELTRFIAGHSDRRVLTRAIDAAFRRVRKRDGDTQLRREARAIASSLDWLVDERWLERSDARDLRGFMNKVLP